MNVKIVDSNLQEAQPYKKVSHQYQHSLEPLQANPTCVMGQYSFFENECAAGVNGAVFARGKIWDCCKLVTGKAAYIYYFDRKNFYAPILATSNPDFRR